VDELLLDAVVVDVEVGEGEIADGVVVFVEDDDVELDEAGGGAEDGGVVVLGQGGGGEGGHREEQGGCREQGGENGPASHATAILAPLGPPPIQIYLDTSSKSWSTVLTLSSSERCVVSKIWQPVLRAS